jgi:hypothetical protein
MAGIGMHYTAMQGTIFTAHGPFHDPQANASFDQITLALALAGIAFVTLALVAHLLARAEARRRSDA